MKCKHHDLEFEINDEWLLESHMDNFFPDSSAYRVDEALACGQDVFEVAVVDIAPMNERAKKKGVFCDNLKVCYNGATLLSINVHLCHGKSNFMSLWHT